MVHKAAVKATQISQHLSTCPLRGSDESVMTLGSTDGQRTIYESKEVFSSEIDTAFSQINFQSQETKSVRLAVCHQAHGRHCGCLPQFVSGASLGTQHQVVAFAEKYGVHI